MKRTGLYSIILILILIAGCEFTAIDIEPKTEPGILTIHLTDAPFPYDIVEEANITITRVEIYGGSDSARSKYLNILEDSITFNLLSLRNGIMTTLLEAEVPEGVYTSMRLYVGEASILLTDQRTFDLKVPSGEQTGIKVKIEPGITIESGLNSELLLDFDVSKSFVLNGNTKKPEGIKGFRFKPVVRAVNYTTSGTIAGTVIDSENSLLEGIEVWIEADTIITTAYTNAEGIYGMLGIPVGSYSMFATGEGYDTAKYDLVEVIEGNRMIKNFKLNPL